MRRFARALALAGVAASAVGIAAPVSAQGAQPAAGAQTVTVVAGEQYGKPLGGTFFWGKDYRDLWTAPIRVEVLDLGTFAGGLQIVRTVGGNESRGLALHGADGRDYTFRPVKKDLSGVVPVEFRDSVLVDIVQDQIAATLPLSEEVKGPLARAVGVLATPMARTVVLPDNDSLGTYRKEFAGQLGVLIEFPQPKSATNPGFHDATEILSASSFWEQRRGGAANVHPDTRAFLRARLLDLFVGDWDRHKGQWRWARLPGQPLLQPVAEDPDMALSDYEGAALTAARFLRAPFVTFEGKYSPFYASEKNGWDVDRFLLTDIEHQEWTAIATDVKSKLTDAAIAGAIGALPPEYQKLRGDELIATLKLRRDNLLTYADQFYRYMAGEVDVQGSNAAEVASVEWQADGGLQVSIADQSGGAPYYRRRFVRDETKEVRVYLHGGDDRVSIQGQKTGDIKVRVIGGPGNDRVDNASGAKVTLYDSEGQNQVEGRGMHVDSRNFTMDPRAEPNDLEWVPNQDWGGITGPIIGIGYSADPGIILGWGFDVLKNGFRKYPYSSHQTFQAAYATGVSKPFLDYTGAFKRTGSNMEWILRARFSGIEQLRFYGFGNETPFNTSAHSLYEISDYQTELFPAVGYSKKGYFLAVGPFLQYSASGSTKPLTVLGTQQPLGFGNFGHVGLRVEANLDKRKGKDVFAPGLAVNTTLKQNFAAWDAEEPFGSFAADLEGHAVGVPNRLFFSMKAGGKQAWGEYPFFEAAYLGRRTTLGFGWNRFAGDALLYGGAEADFVFKKMRRLVPGDVGMSGFLDVGRVYLDGEDSSKWHPSGGVGLFYAAFQRTTLLGMKIGTNEDRWFVSFEMRLAGLGF